MGFQIVEYQGDFSPSVLTEPFHKCNQALTVHYFFAEHTSNLDLVGDGRNHIDPVFTAGLA